MTSFLAPSVAIAFIGALQINVFNHSTMVYGTGTLFDFDVYKLSPQNSTSSHTSVTN